MMPRPKIEEPLTKLTLQLFSEDVEWFRKHHPEAYTVAIRDVLHSYVRVKKISQKDESYA